VKKVYGDQGVRKTACFNLNQESRLNGLSDSDKGNVVDAIEAVMTE
jgi:hypothetical protein